MINKQTTKKLNKDKNEADSFDIIKYPLGNSNSNFVSTIEKKQSDSLNGEQLTITVNSASEKQEFLAFLGAAQIPHWLLQRNQTFIFKFLEEDYALALREWKHFNKENLEKESLEQENRVKKRAASIVNKEDLKYSFASSLFIVFSLVYFHYFVRTDFQLNGWLESGAANNIKILSGEFFRTITSLALHSNLNHLLSNSLGFMIFAPLLIKETGAGWGWLLALLSGMTGNYINAEFHSWLFNGVHLSIGASTSLFGIVGLIGSKQIRSGWRSKRRLRQAFIIPVFALLALLAIMGVSGQNTDIFAHLFGMLSGIVLGIIFGSLDRHKANPLFQTASWALFFGIILLAWR